LTALWIFILLPLVLALVYWGLQRMRYIALGLAVAACGVCVLAAWRIPLGTTTQIVGATLTLTHLGRFGLILMGVSVGAVLAYSAWQPQGWTITPFLLINLAFVNLALLIRPLPFAVLFGQLAALHLIFPLHSGPVPTTTPSSPPVDPPARPQLPAKPDHPQFIARELVIRVSSFRSRVPRAPGELRRGAVSYLIMVTLAIPCFLLALWLINHRATLPDPAGVIQPIVMLLGLGMGSLLAAIPLHIWWLMITEDGPPLVFVFIGATFPIIGIIFLLNVLSQTTWLATAPQVSNLLLWGGAVSALSGGILAAPQRQLSRLVAYSAIHDSGVILVGLGAMHPVAAAGALFCLVHRAIALGWLGIAHGEFRRSGAGVLPELGTVAARLPVATSALLLGGLALSGWPLSGGFPGRWLIYSATLLKSPGIALALIAGSSLVAAGYLRLLRAILEARQPGERFPEDRVTLIATALLLGLSLLLALAPNLILPLLHNMLVDLPFPASPL